MHAPDLGRLLGLQLPAGLAEQGVDEQAAAHADAPVDTPHRELDADALERDAPGEHVLIHAVDQRAVEIKQESGAGGHASGNVIPGRRTPGPCPGVARKRYFNSMSCGRACPVGKWSKSTSHLASSVIPVRLTFTSRTRYGTLPSRFESSEVLTYSR